MPVCPDGGRRVVPGQHPERAIALRRRRLRESLSRQGADRALLNVLEEVVGGALRLPDHGSPLAPDRPGSRRARNVPTLGWSGSAADERRMGHMNRSRSGAEETDVSITPPKTWAVGAPAVANALRYSLEQTTVRRTALTLLNLDRTRDFDCPGGAWPEPDPAHPETNVLVPLDSTAEISNTPTWKGIVVRLERTTTGAAGATDTAPRSDGP